MGKRLVNVVVKALIHRQDEYVRDEMDDGDEIDRLGEMNMYRVQAIEDTEWVESLRQAQCAQAKLKEFFRNQEELMNGDGNVGGRIGLGLKLATVLTLLLAFVAVIVA